MRIRKIEVTDALAFLKLNQALDKETMTMLYERDERTVTGKEQEHQIKKMIESQYKMIFVAENERDGELVGYILINGCDLKRISHRASIVIGVLKAFQRQGIGSNLLEQAFIWCEEVGVHRLELTVMATNRPAMSLYSKKGFLIEGLRREAIFINNSYIDEFYMYKLLKKVG